MLSTYDCLQQLTCKADMSSPCKYPSHGLAMSKTAKDSKECTELTVLNNSMFAANEAPPAHKVPGLSSCFLTQYKHPYVPLSVQHRQHVADADAAPHIPEELDAKPGTSQNEVCACTHWILCRSYSFTIDNKCN